jgi:beta-glucanase (GH16 family)
VILSLLCRFLSSFIMRIRTLLSSHTFEMLLLVLLIVHMLLDLPSQQRQVIHQQTAPIWHATEPILPPGLDSSWHLVFDDEFNGRTLDSTKWITNAGRGGTCTSVDVGGAACFDSSAISVSNGNVHIEANKESINGMDYLAGIINTDTKYYFTYGYFDIRAKMPKGAGLWGSIWLYNQAGDANEIDIVELLGKDPTITHQTLHSPFTRQHQYNSIGEDWTRDYHDYAVKWQPGRLTFYIDGVARGTVTNGVPSEKLFLISSLDVGGRNAWSGPPSVSTPWPSYINIDYVRVYQQSSSDYQVIRRTE